MASWCGNCGRQVEADEKFCRQCGMPQDLAGEEATTWFLSPENAPRSTETSRINPPTTSPAGVSTGSPVNPPPDQMSIPPGSTYQQPAGSPYDRPAGSAYAPPTGSGYAPTPSLHVQPPYPVPYRPPTPAGGSKIKLGDWLTDGWKVYKENWALMSVAGLLGGFLSLCTAGILAGPLLMGMFSMAFKTMRGEQPTMSDLFNWRGRFLQAFIAFLVFFIAHVAVAGLGSAGAFFKLISLALIPMFTIMLSLTMSNILDRGADAVNSINDVARKVFSRDWFLWWLVGLVIAAIVSGGTFACGVGVLVTLPWMISSAAVAYRDTFGIDDPNRTNQ